MKFRQLDDLFHTQKTVKRLLHLVPPRTLRKNLQCSDIICYLMRICVITSYYCKVVVGLEAQFCTLTTVRGVRGLGIRMLTIDKKTCLYAEDRGLQVPMVLQHDKIVGTQFCDTLSHTS